MPTIPVYDAHETADPGQLAPVQLSTAVADAEGRTGSAISGIGNAVENLAEHFQKREEQKQNFAASIGLQSLHESIIAGDAKAQNQMPIDGNGWAASRQQNTQTAVANYVKTLPSNLQETFGAKAGLLAQKQSDLYAQQEVAQQGQYYTGVAQQEGQKMANGLYADPSIESYNAARETQLHRIDNLPIPPDQKQILRQKAEVDFAEASLRGTADQAAKAVAANKLGVIGPGGTYSKPPAGGAPDQSQTAADGTPVPVSRPNFGAEGPATPDEVEKYKAVLTPAQNETLKKQSEARKMDPDALVADIITKGKAKGIPLPFDAQGNKVPAPAAAQQQNAAPLTAKDPDGKTVDLAAVGFKPANDAKNPGWVVGPDGVPRDPDSAAIMAGNMPKVATPAAASGAAPMPVARPANLTDADVASAKPQAAVLRGDDAGAGSNYLSRIRAIESGGRNVTNAGSGATGVYQFIPSTWNQLIRQHPDLGLTQGDIHDPAKQEIAIKAFTADNAAVLQSRLGRAPTDAELYLAHQQGAAGAARLLAHPGMLASEVVNSSAITSNGGRAGMTAGEFTQMWANKYNGTHGTAAGSYSGGQGDPGGHYGLDPNDPRLAMVPWQQRRAIEQDAMRGAEAFQAQQNAGMQQQHADFMNTTQLAANDGKYGLADLEKDRARGAITQYGDVSKLQSIIASKQGNNDALSEFSMKLADPHSVFNPVDKDDMKAVDAGYAALTKGGVNPADAAQRVIERTGIVPTETTTALRGAMVSGDQGRAQGALTATANILRVNPNILDTLPGGEKLAKQANTFNHYTNDMGMTAQAATQKIVEAETPEYQRKVALALKDQDIGQVVKQNLSVADLESSFNTGLPYFGRPSVGAAQPKIQQALMGDYEDWFKIHYQESGDVNQAKALAQADLKKVWGPTNVSGSQVFTRYPIEQAPAYAGVPGIADKVADAAVASIKDGTGQDVPREKLMLTPSPDTPDAWKAGKAPPMTLQWMDDNGHMQIAPKPFTADPGVMRFRQSVNRQQQFEETRATRMQMNDGRVQRMEEDDGR